MEQTNNAFLQIKNLEKIYPNGEKAVYNFNLDIDKNEFIVIVGPSGCGKSTTLRMVAGLEDISAGEVVMDGELLNYKPCKDRKMAIVFQSYALYPQMSVYENIAFPLTINKYPYPVVNAALLAVKEANDLLASIGFDGIMAAICGLEGKKRDESLAVRLGVSLPCAQTLLNAVAACKEQPLTEQLLVELMERINAEELAKVEAAGVRLNDKFEQLDENGEVVIVQRKMTPFEIKQKVFETANVLDLTPYLDKLPKELSGGQMQRVALGRAIVKNVSVFLMDEPLSNLDAKLRLVMRSEIVKLHNRINATTLYVTHDQTEAMTMATRIVVMSRGFVQQIGTPEEVYNNPCNIFIARFIGSPSMNIFDMDYDKANGTLVAQGITVPVDEGFVNRYNEFYNKKVAEFNNLVDNFDAEAIKQVRKVLSVIDQQGEKVPKQVEKTNIFKKLFKKKNKQQNTVAKEFVIAQEKAAQLAKYLEGGKLHVGIRPERIKIEKYDATKTYPNGTVLQPVLCELLGAEYNVHFTFCGKNMVGKIDAKEKITPNDKIVVQLSFEDVYIFDPITGEVI